MKDLIKLTLKVPLVHKNLIVIFFLLSFSQINVQTNCDAKTYEIINAVFDSGETEIYETTLFEKGWARYFEDYKEIFDRVGIPTSISNDKLKEILGKEKLRYINSSIYGLKPCRLSTKHLNGNINLSSNFDRKNSISRGVFRISKPIIVEDNIAILKTESINESPIYILQKKDGKWEIIYTFYDWYILED